MAESQSVKNTPGRLGVMPGWLHSGLLPRPKCKSRRSATQVVFLGRAEGVLFLVKCNDKYEAKGLRLNEVQKLHDEQRANERHVGP